MLVVFGRIGFGLLIHCSVYQLAIELAILSVSFFLSFCVVNFKEILIVTS